MVEPELSNPRRRFTAHIQSEVEALVKAPCFIHVSILLQGSMIKEGWIQLVYISVSCVSIYLSCTIEGRVARGMIVQPFKFRGELLHPL